MISKINSFNSNQVNKTSSRISDSEQNKIGKTDYQKEDEGFGLTESIKETIGALKNSLAQNRSDRVQYDMTSFNNNQEDDLKFL